MSFDTIIRGGTVATASDTVACDVGIRDGKIVALGHDLGSAETTIDATGRLVLPGGIDSHVHFAQPSGDGIVMADGFASGTRSAAFGGNTTVLPFCLQEKGQTLREALRRYRRGRLRVPKESAGSIGRPTLATADKGRAIYERIRQRIRERIFATPAPDA